MKIIVPFACSNIVLISTTTNYKPNFCLVFKKKDWARLDMKLKNNSLFFAACDCNEAGSSSNNCDSASGQCPCKENIAGDKCDEPAPGYYDFPEPQGNFPKLYYF